MTQKDDIATYTYLQFLPTPIHASPADDVWCHRPRNFPLPHAHQPQQLAQQGRAVANVATNILKDLAAA